MKALSSSRVRTSTTSPAGSTFDALTSSSTAAWRKSPSIVLLELLADLALDVGAQLVERVELGRGARQLVVERRQHLLVQLLDRDGGAAASSRRRAPSSRRSSRPTSRRMIAALDLVDEPLAAELDDVVAVGAVLGDDVDDGDVALAARCGPRRATSSATMRCSASSCCVDDLLGHLDLALRHLERRPVGRLGLRLHRELGGEAPGLVVARRQLVVELGLLGRAGARRARRRSRTSCRCATRPPRSRRAACRPSR